MNIQRNILAAALVSAFAFATAQAETVVVTKTVEKPVVVEKVVEQPVVVERVIEQPVVRVPVVVQEKILVPVGGKISKQDVHAVLAGAGYHDIHDIDWLDHRGVW